MGKTMGSILFGLFSILALVFVNGFFVAAEFSLVGARRTRIAQLANEGHPGAKAAQKAIEHLDSYIAATQLGITLASLGLGWIGEPAIAHLLEPLLHAVMPAENQEAFRVGLAVAIGFSIVTVLHIVLGELVPKSIALQRPEGTSIIVSRPTSWFLAVFRPIIWVMNGIGNSIVRMLGFEPAAGHAQVHSAEELEMLVRTSREAGLLQASEEKLLRKVFDFSDIQVREIMRPRVEVNALPMQNNAAELMQKLKAHHFSRYPVYDENLDNVVGVLHIKDLLDAIIANPQLLLGDKPTLDLRPLLRETMFIPATVSVDQLLEQMQQKQTHLAVIIDEYGGMAGVVTLEDILEEIVGEVQDEFDLEENPISEKDGITILDGLVSMSEIEERYGDVEEEIAAASIGGYILEALGRIPKLGDSLNYGNYEFRVRKMDGMRVAQIEVRPKHVQAPKEEEDKEAKE
jgi:putative hemolysin